jgi:16S rRNA (uracil1498-N3)-methyltransferase
MRIPRIYLEQALAENTNCLLSDDAAHHVSRVLRMKAGQSISLFNSRGGYFDAIITRIDKRNVEVATGDHHPDECESPLAITLVQGISRGERMDYTLQKAVELGVQHIIPVLCEYTNVKLDDEKKQKRHEHWRKIIINACEQCGRNRIPSLALTQELDGWLDIDTNELKLILHPGTSVQLCQLENKHSKVALLAGPEGGFSDIEVAHAMKHGYQPITLGPRILRTETAALAAITACQVLWGDLH